MDSLITAAAHALAAGDPLGALNYVALREDAPALALRGIAMAQLGDFAHAKTLVQRAKRRFGTRDARARARCTVIEAEIALASRDLSWPATTLDAAQAALQAHGDHVNAAHARYLQIKRSLLIGHLTEAARLLALQDPAALPPALQAAHQLATAGIAMRHLQANTAQRALQRAAQAAQQARIPALLAEVDSAQQMLDAPVARLLAHGVAKPIAMREVETLLASPALVVDANRHAVFVADRVIPLAGRPVLFSLLRTLAEAYPGGVARADLIMRAFRARHADESHRARLRVELGRLRKLLGRVADIDATKTGFILAPRDAADVMVLARPAEEKHASVLALLADGEAWASSALALALGNSQRHVQRALETLLAQHKIQAVGRGRARRWLAPPMPGFATTLLLPVPLIGG